MRITTEETIPCSGKDLEEAFNEKLQFLENKIDYYKMNYDIQMQATNEELQKSREENERLKTKLDTYISQESEREELIKECLNSPPNTPNCITDFDPLREEFYKALYEVDVRLIECEQYSRRESLVISGIPESVSKNQFQLQQKVISILGLIGLVIIPDDISACHRLFQRPGTGYPAKVIVRFVNRKIVNFCLDHRDDLQQKAFKEMQLNLRFFESLCTKNEESLRISKRLKDQGKIRDCYLRNGFVKIVDENGHSHKVTHPDSLKNSFRELPE